MTKHIERELEGEEGSINNTSDRHGPHECDITPTTRNATKEGDGDNNTPNQQTGTNDP